MNDSIKIGVLYSQSGPMALTERSVLENTLAAIDEVNQSGGLLGRPLEPVLRDGCSSAEIFASQTLDLLLHGVQIFVGGLSSVARKAMRPIIEDADAVLFFPAPHEGLEMSKSIVYTGLSLNQQIIPLFQWLNITKQQSIYHVGSEMVYQKVMGNMLRLLCSRYNIRFAGECYIPERLSDDEKEQMLFDIFQEDTDLFVISATSNDTVALQRLFHDQSFARHSFLSINGRNYDTDGTLFRLCSDEKRTIAEDGAWQAIELLKAVVEQTGDLSPSAILSNLPGTKLKTDRSVSAIEVKSNLHLEKDSYIVKMPRRDESTNRPDQTPQTVFTERLAPLPYLGVEETQFNLQPLVKQAMDGYADSIYLSLLLDDKNKRQKEIEKELQRAHTELEDRVRQRTQSLEETNRKLASEVHQRQLLEDAVGESQRRFRQILESTSLLTVILDEFGSIVYVNQTLLQKTGWSRSEIINRNWYKHFAPHNPNLVEKYHTAVNNGHIKQNFEYPILTKTGDTLFIRWTNTLLIEADKPTGVVSIGEDVTDQHAATEALKLAKSELEHRVSERTRQLEEANQRLLEIATLDELTGIANRRRFNEVLDSEIRRARRDNRPIALLFCDVDFFKQYNDFYGHQAGDRCLSKIGSVFEKLFRRAGDLPARYGGEEFAVILPGADAFQAVLQAERLRADIEKMRIEHQASAASQWVTMSIGIASTVPRLHHTAEFLIEKSDQALYTSKSEGRNRITVAQLD